MVDHNEFLNRVVNKLEGAEIPHILVAYVEDETNTVFIEISEGTDIDTAIKMFESCMRSLRG